MTPDKARRLLDGTTPGPWEWADCIGDGGVRHMALRNPSGEKAVITADAESYQSEVRGTPADLRLTAAAPTLAAMIAGMREEWGVEVTHYHDGDLHTRWGYDDRKDAEAFAHYMGRDPRWNAARVVRRYVTKQEVAE